MADKISTDEFFSATSSNGYETYTHFADEILLSGSSKGRPDYKICLMKSYQPAEHMMYGL